MTSQLHSQLQQAFPHLEFIAQGSLAPYTTVKIGGPAEVLWVASNQAALIEVVQHCKKHAIELTILGWGANTLIADRGIPGLVIINQTRKIEVLDPSTTSPTQGNNPSVSSPAPRWHQLGQHASRDLFSYYTGTESLARVQLDSGTPLPFAINSLYELGITGLEWFIRIPATVGGAIYNNIHGADRYIGDAVESVAVVDDTGQLLTLQQDELAFDYDLSRFHHTSEVIISATLLLARGPVRQAKAAGIEWARHKQHQPQRSLGCVFQNLDAQEQARLRLPSSSVGYLIDKVLSLSGFSIGDAQVSAAHAAFIENLDSATAHDYLAVMSHVHKQAFQQVGVRLQPEIFFKGFSAADLQAAFPHWQQKGAS